MRLLAACLLALAFTGYFDASSIIGATGQTASPRTRLPINNDWRFTKGDPPESKTNLAYNAGFFLNGEHIKRPGGSPHRC
jgi:hypothetical protein